MSELKKYISPFDLDVTHIEQWDFHVTQVILKKTSFYTQSTHDSPTHSSTHSTHPTQTLTPIHYINSSYRALISRVGDLGFGSMVESK